MSANGGFAQYALHHVSALSRLPARLSAEDSVLITTAGTGLYGLHTAGGSVTGQDVVIFGPGPVGLMTARLCRLMGAGRVIVVGTRGGRLELARRLGADHTVHARDADPVRTVLELTDGTGVDLAIEASGAVGAPGHCARVTKRGGRILFLAFYPEPVRLDLSAIVQAGITMYTSRGEGGDSVRRAVALAAAADLRGAELVTHRFPLENITEAFRVLRDREGDPLKIVVVPPAPADLTSGT